jgi:hypothetical protein
VFGTTKPWLTVVILGGVCVALLRKYKKVFLPWTFLGKESCRRLLWICWLWLRCTLSQYCPAFRKQIRKTSFKKSIFHSLFLLEKKIMLQETKQEMSPTSPMSFINKFSICSNFWACTNAPYILFLHYDPVSKYLYIICVEVSVFRIIFISECADATFLLL